jgi:hypothetical protein
MILSRRPRGRKLTGGAVGKIGGVMSGEACPLPTPKSESEEVVIRRVLSARRIAVVGLSDDPSKPSNAVASYLQRQGYEIIPVNPNHDKVLGQKCYKSLAEVPGQIDLVDVFRRPQFCADVARDAVAAGAKAIWLQSGIVSNEAREIALKAGLDFVQNRCLMVEHGQHVS